MSSNIMFTKCVAFWTNQDKWPVLNCKFHLVTFGALHHFWMLCPDSAGCHLELIGGLTIELETHVGLASRGKFSFFACCIFLQARTNTSNWFLVEAENLQNQTRVLFNGCFSVHDYMLRLVILRNEAIQGSASGSLFINVVRCASF